MKASIRIKLLVMSILLVLLTTIGISATYYVLIKQDTQKESRQRIQSAFAIMLDDLATRLRTYTITFDDLLKENANLGWVTYSYNQEPEQIGEVSFLVTNFKELVEEFRKFGRIISLDQLTLYGADGRLLLLSQRDGERETAGVYTISQHQNDTYLPLDNPSEVSPILFGDKPIPDTELPSGVTVAYEGEIPDALIATPFNKARIIHQAHEFTNSIATSVEEQTAATSQISGNISDVARGSDEITHTVADVAEGAQRTSERAASVKNAAEELASFADQLQQLVEIFKI